MCSQSHAKCPRSSRDGVRAWHHLNLSSGAEADCIARCGTALFDSVAASQILTLKTRRARSVSGCGMRKLVAPDDFAVAGGGDVVRGRNEVESESARFLGVLAKAGPTCSSPKAAVNHVCSMNIYREVCSAEIW